MRSNRKPIAFRHSARAGGLRFFVDADLPAGLFAAQASFDAGLLTLVAETAVMRRSLNCVHVHFVWATWDRLPLITPAIEPRLYAAIRAKCDELKCPLLALGGVENHMHLLVRLHPSISQADFVRDVKGATSHLVTHTVTPGNFFKWQGAYGSFAVEVSNLPIIAAYIARQKEHHHSGNEQSDWEAIFETEESAG